MWLLFAAKAGAAAYYFLDSGVRAQGRGGAFIAGADDLSAQYYNPAALVRIRRTTANVNVWTVNQFVDFDRADELGWNSFEAVENEAPPFPEPAGGVAIPLDKVAPWLNDTVLAVGLYEPTSPLLSYPVDGPQRYALLSASIIQAYVGPTLARRLTPWLSVGAGFQYTFMRVDQSLAAYLCNSTEPTCGGDDVRNDVRMDLSVADMARFSWNAGLLVEPTEWLAIGASVQPAIHYEPTGSMTTTFNAGNRIVVPELTALEFRDDDVRLLVDLPWIVRAGVQFSTSPRWHAEVAGTYARWSDSPTLTITDIDLALTTREDGAVHGQTLLVTDDVVFKTGFQDAWSLRAGGDFAPLKWLTLRAGGHYETSAVPDALVGVSVVDGPKAGGGVGASVRFAKRFMADVSGLGQWQFPREIEDSELAQQALLVDLDNQFQTTVTEGKVVGNGTIDSTLVVVGVGLSVEFGAMND